MTGHEPMDIDPDEGDVFCCGVCHGHKPLQHLLDLDCSCLVCSCCGDEHITPRLVPLLPALVQEDRLLSEGQLVKYRQRDGKLVPAKVVEVDRSIQPFGYGILLEGATEIRFTEHTRLFPWGLNQGAPVAWMEQGFPVVRCPSCSIALDRAQLARICPQDLLRLEEALTNAWLEAKGIIRCPNPDCGYLIEKLPADVANNVGCTCASSSSTNGSIAGNCAACCKQQHRYRCSACTKSFCDSCWKTPYHEGLTCREAATPCCPFCESRVPEAADLSTADLSPKQLREQATQLGADISWCLERKELIAVYKRARQVCRSCRPHLLHVCTKQLTCGHWCWGVRGTAPCLPCLQPGCQSLASNAGDGSCCICFEPLSSAAVIQLVCPGAHFVHLSCAVKRLQVGCPGPSLTFDYLFCPLCGSGKDGRCGNVQVMTAQPHLQHVQLQADLQHALKLREQVVCLAKARLRLGGLAKQEAELQPGGNYDGRPADYAVSKYLFYQCSKCRLPYFGGAKECGIAQQPAEQAVAFDAKELVCGSCSALAAGANCPQHGRQYVEWKCLYCCNLASWFCWGTTHMCSSCHEHPERRHGNKCPGVDRCALKVPHPPPGDSCCLGCGICRHGNM